ncbi:unnamed protein product [Polarella glacialis]|uniref:Uncharacterized protein n=1 Tax=Polarella glacialis TaxID=89957 RepID=A0A813IG97_POLGL|nr:unnamed protein product [Polarella glacialis]
MATAFPFPAARILCQSRGRAAIGVRCFGVEREMKKLRLRGAVGQAYRQAGPPKLQKKALEHYIKGLKAHGGDKAQLAISGSQGSSLKTKEPYALTSEEKTRLLARYLPEEEETTKTLKKNSHKWLWRWLRRRDFRRFDACIEELRKTELPFDEVTYNLAIYGMLLNPRRDDELAREVFAEMEEEGRFHPALLRLQGGFVESYFELKEVDAAPNAWNLLKVTKTFWHISVNFKRQRVKAVRARLAAAASDQRRLADGTLGLEANGWHGQVDDADDVLSDAEVGPRVKFPARRPRQLKGVHKGGGVPRRRMHRWKH